MSVKLQSPVLERLGPPHDTDRRRCEWPGCRENGPHRAPRSRKEFNEFRWFCKAHAAKYNKAWNFFADMTDDEVEAIVRHDTVWNRPSWPIGTGPAVDAFMRGHFKDPFGAFEGNKSEQEHPPGETPGTELETNVQRALAVFNLEIPLQAADVKRRYKELVKRHHPDAQGTVENSDDRIKEINHAYAVILEFLNA